jgi:hypothetical protein
MRSQLRLCSIHHQIEVLPGIWKRDRLLTRATSEVSLMACSLLLT